MPIEAQFAPKGAPLSSIAFGRMGGCIVYGKFQWGDELFFDGKRC